MSERLLVTGAGGFIGGHLVANLLREGNEVRAVDINADPAMPEDGYGWEN